MECGQYFSAEFLVNIRLFTLGKTIFNHPISCKIKKSIQSLEKTFFAEKRPPPSDHQLSIVIIGDDNIMCIITVKRKCVHFLLQLINV